jgi:AraC-like DNA-binding protein
MSIREHRPPTVLADWLDRLWERDRRASGPARILPDGCIDVVFSPSTGLRLVGANTVAFVTDVAPAELVVGARMVPGGAPALLGVSAPAQLDRRLPLRAVLGDDAARLEERLHGAPDPAATLRAWLAQRASMAPAPDPLVVATVGRLRTEQSSGVELAAALGVSERGLRRRVTAAVGYGPKRLARVLRLRRALALARAGDELAAVAFTAGYTDQAHLGHDCRELAGAPPTTVLGAGRFEQDRAAAA